MLKTLLSLLVTAVLLLATVPSARANQTGSQSPTVETVKSRIARLGIGAKAKATVKLKNGTKVKGYVAQAGEDDFVIRNRKTDAPTTISYADVLKVDDNKGHSTARNVAIGVAVGVGVTILAIFAIIAGLDE